MTLTGTSEYDAGPFYHLAANPGKSLVLQPKYTILVSLLLRKTNFILPKHKQIKVITKEQKLKVPKRNISVETVR